MANITERSTRPVYPTTTSDLVRVNDITTTLTNVIDEIKSNIIDINEEIHDIRYPRRYGWSKGHRKTTRKFINKRWNFHK